MPQLGGRKLHHLLRNTLLKSGHKQLGRDRFFQLLREYNLLVTKKRKKVYTTNSNHPFRKYKNLIKDICISRVNQVWVSDITYLKVNNEFCYASLITDVHSRKIVGYHVSNTLELKGTLTALKFALRKGVPEIHHSDRGLQYCAKQYTHQLKMKNIKISMTENGNCYENAIAERINGILKYEFNLNATFTSLKNVKKAVKQAVNTYNQSRPHWSLNFKVPNHIFLWCSVDNY